MAVIIVTIGFYVIMREPMVMAYLKVSMPPVRVPVMRSSVRAIIVRVMKTPVVMMVRSRMMSRSGSMEMVWGRVGTMSPMLGVGNGVNMLLNVFVLLYMLSRSMSVSIRVLSKGVVMRRVEGWRVWVRMWRVVNTQ
jgi:hypothetical protein